MDYLRSHNRKFESGYQKIENKFGKMSTDLHYPTEHYYKKEEINLCPPDSYSSYNINIKKYLREKNKFKEYTISKPYITKVDNPVLVGAYPFVIKDKKILTDAHIKPIIGLMNIARSPPKLLSLDHIHNTIHGKNILLYNSWSSNYFHWLIDNLSRLQFVEYTDYNISELRIILGPDPKNWQIESLELLGFNKDNIVLWNNLSANVECLLIPSSRREGIISKQSVNWMREKILAGHSTKNSYSNRVYVSREDASRRRILNETEVLDSLSKYGFKKYTMTDLSVIEQAELFNQAEIIVSPHGANLANLIFTEGSSIISLQGENNLDSAMMVLSQLVGSTFRPILCDRESSDLIVDLNELDGVIQDIL